MTASPGRMGGGSSGWSFVPIQRRLHPREMRRLAVRCHQEDGSAGPAILLGLVGAAVGRPGGVLRDGGRRFYRSGCPDRRAGGRDHRRDRRVAAPACRRAGARAPTRWSIHRRSHGRRRSGAPGSLGRCVARHRRQAGDRRRRLSGMADDLLLLCRSLRRPRRPHQRTGGSRLPGWSRGPVRRDAPRVATGGNHTDRVDRRWVSGGGGGDRLGLRGSPRCPRRRLGRVLTG